MDWEKKELHWKQIGEPQTTQILLEGDIIVSDNKADVEGILCWNGKISVADQRVMEERVSISGELLVHMLYTGKGDEERVYALSGALPIEDIIYVDGLTKDMTVTIEGNILHLDCRVINDRKLGIKCIISFVAEPKGDCKKSVLSGAETEGLAFQKEQITLAQRDGETEEIFTVKEEITLPNTLPAVGELLRTEMRLVEKEIRPLEGKLMLRASLLARVLYADDMGMVHSFEEKVPFQGYLEDGNMTAKSMVDVVLVAEDLVCKPLLDEDGESRLLSLSATIKSLATPLDLVEETVVMDAYAPRMETALTKEKIAYPKHMAMGKNQFHMKETLRLEGAEPAIMQLEAFWGDVILENMKPIKDGMEIEGVLAVDLLYHSATEGKLSTVQRGFPFTQKMEMKGVLPEDLGKCRCSLEGLEIQSLSEKDGEIQADILLEGIAKREGVVEVVSEVVCSEKADSSGDLTGAIIYQAQAGDSLWSVAKRYGTTQERIQSINELDTDKLEPNQKILIVKERTKEVVL